jgi:hypothetical protein
VTTKCINGFASQLEEILMAASTIIEEEEGTYVRSPHPHNGYYAGDFSAQPLRVDHSAIARWTPTGLQASPAVRWR